jgi:hypothetical protein
MVTRLRRLKGKFRMTLGQVRNVQTDDYGRRGAEPPARR